MSGEHERDARRRALAARQAQLVAALVEDGPLPVGISEVRARAVAVVLARKRHPVPDPHAQKRARAAGVRWMHRLWAALRHLR